jgi:hypothetical protein
MKSPSRKGDFAEFYAVTWLWDQGYEVFKNCGSSGLVDLVAMKDGEIKLIDVKTIDEPVHAFNPKTGRKNGGGGRLSREQKKLGVCMLKFNSKTRGLAFRRHKHETY